MRTHDKREELHRKFGGPLAGRPAATSAQAQTMPPVASRRVLIVDDDEDSRLLARIMFKILGYETDQAADGLAAVDLFSRQEYALVLMDCQMPVCDGFEATAQIRAIEHQRRAKPTPIIAVSNASDGDYPQRTRSRGATAFLRKPLTIDLLRRALTELASSGARVR
jgi:CheY-like chemotaxis protein